MSDAQLLQKYAESRCESAFEELVNRHLDLVYSAALRQVQDPHLAEDVTQGVFLFLAQKAESIKESVFLPGWLLNTTRYAAGHALRSRRRRMYHETNAAKAAVNNQDDESVWDSITPLLDHALVSLRARDRKAVILRYLQNKSMREIAAELSVSEDAAKKRVASAIERLRGVLRRKGIAVPVAMLATLLPAKAVMAAPAELAAATVSTVLVTAKGVVLTATSTAIAKGIAKMIFWTKMKTAAIVTVAAVAVAGAAAPIVVEAMSEAPAVEVKEAITAVEEVSFPGDMIMHINTGPLETSIKDTEEFLIAVTKGTPAAALMYPGMTEQWLQKVAPIFEPGNAPPGLIDQSQGIQVVFFNPAPEDPANIRFAVILPIRNLEESLSVAAQYGWQVTSPKVDFENPDTSADFYHLDFIDPAPIQLGLLTGLPNNCIAVGERQSLPALADTLKKWKSLKLPEDTTLRITIDVEKLMQVNVEVLDTFLAELPEQMAEGNNPEFIRKWLPNWLAMNRQVFEMLNGIRYDVSMNEEKLVLTGEFLPKAGSELERLVQAYENEMPTYPLLQLLPADSVAAVSSNIKPEVMEVIQVIRAKAEEFFGSHNPQIFLAEIEEPEEHSQLLSLLEGEACMAVVPLSTGAGFKNANLTEVKDAKAFQEILPEELANFTDTFNDITQELAMPFSLESTFDDAAGEVAGMPYSKFAFKFAEVPPAPEMAIFQQYWQHQQLTTFTDRLVIEINQQGFGLSEDDAVASLAKLINQVEQANPGVGQREEFRAALQATDTKQLAFGAIYLLDTMKLLGQQPAALQKLAADLPLSWLDDQVLMVSQALGELPDSTQPVTGCIGVEAGKLQIAVKLPTEVISETAVALTQTVVKSINQWEAQQKALRNQQQNKLKQIHRGISSFREQHQRMPSSLEELAATVQELSNPQSFISPTKTQLQAEGGEGFHSDYLYLPITQVPEKLQPNTVILIDKPSNHPNGGWALLNNGNILWYNLWNPQEGEALMSALVHNDNPGIVDRLIPDANNGDDGPVEVPADFADVATYVRPSLELEFSLPLEWNKVEATQKAGEFASITAKRVTEPLELDGALDEEAWQESPFQVRCWQVTKAQRSTIETGVKALYDDTFLYLAFACSDPDPTQLQAIADGEPEFFDSRDDILAMMIQPDESEGSYYQLAFNTAGIRFDQNVRQEERDYTFQLDWQAICKPCDGYWTAEVKLPLAEFTQADQLQSWRINFFRIFRNDNKAPSSWSYQPYADWHKHKRLGRLVFD
ncbi:MAG: sigma-70 family RNA polymerase sigma factor [Planctomycetes bacterium]|nr:sigma-70 family RNA polymerase sigma factor [Planctomycetota bacterium]